MLKIVLFLLPCFCYGSSAKTLYSSLDPLSIPQHIALFELFPETEEGKKALQDAFYLMTGEKGQSTPLPFQELNAALSGFLSLTPGEIKPLSNSFIKTIENIASSLPNRRLKGYLAQNETFVLDLPDDEIDIARALLLTDSSDPSSRRTYEALLDLMALQIRARLSQNPSPYEKILSINQFVFHEMKFRFPAHSSYSEEIDLYTFLPSVINSRKGVCLGVSLLYLSLAQRLDLPLEIVTPPGHIYIRYGKERNIETTARGVHLPCDAYMDLELLSLKTRTKKEAIGLIHVNQAASFWKKEEHEKALACYDKALTYLPDEPLIQEFRAYHLLFLGQEAEGRALLNEVKDKSSFDTLSKNTLPEDFLEGKVDLEGLKLTLSDPGEEREDLLERKEKLQTLLKKYPSFRAGHFALALTWLNLKRAKEAIDALVTYHTLDAKDPSVEYMLAVLYFERFDYVKSWKHFKQLQTLLPHTSYPKAIETLQRELLKVYYEQL